MANPKSNGNRLPEGKAAPTRAPLQESLNNHPVLIHFAQYFTS